MYPSFHDSDNATKQKLLVYNVVIRSKLLYGLDTVSPNSAAILSLDEFHMKGIRRVLKFRSTYVEEP